MAAKAAVLRCSPERLVVENAQNDNETNKPKKDRENVSSDEVDSNNAKNEQRLPKKNCATHQMGRIKQE